jgi:MFS family permease
MSFPAALPVLREEWGLSGTAAGSISTASSLAFTLSLVVLSSLADRVGARRVFLGSSILTVLAAYLIPVFAEGYRSGLFLFTLVALASGGTYTPGLMLVAERFPSDRRGWSMGWFLAAASLGYACSLTATGLMVSRFGWRAALGVIATGSLIGAGLACWTLLPAPPPRLPREPAPSSFTGGVLMNRPAVLLVVGYMFHSWEVLGMWAWTPAFLASALGGAQQSIEGAAAQGAGLAALFHLMGLLATSVSGWLSDRWGRTGVIVLMMTVSTLCSFSFGWLAGAPLLIVLFVGLIYSFSAIGDSPVYSTALSEVVEPRHLGSALAIRSLIGFGAGSLAPFAFGAVLDFTNRGVSDHQSLTWGWAYSLLGLGAAVGLFATLWLRRLPQSRLMAGGRR